MPNTFKELLKDASAQVIPIRLFNLDGTLATGKSPTVYLSKGVGGWTAGNGSIAERGGAGNGKGWYDYTTGAGDLDTAGRLTLEAGDGSGYFGGNKVYVVTELTETKIARLDAAISTRSTLTAAQVNAEVVDVLFTDTIAELTGDPGATPTIAKAVMLLLMALRNGRIETSTLYKILNDAGATILQQQLSDSGTIFTVGKAAAP